MRLIILIFLFTSVISNAQILDNSRTNNLTSTIISEFNNNHFKEIYAFADSSFKANVAESDILSLLNSAATLGKIKKYELAIVEDGSHTYRLYFDNKSLFLDISLASDSTSFSRFGLRPYKLPPVLGRIDFLHDNPLKTHLDSIVQTTAKDYMENKNVAGLSMGVFTNNEMYIYNFGETKKGNGSLPTKNTIYEIGSVTKVFTGILLANAVVEGKVKLDDDIRKYLTGVYPNLEYQGKPITLLQLSNHTSGLPFTVRLPDTQEDPFSPFVNFNDDMLFKILHAVKLDTIPGVQRNYSNLGTAILGQILAKIYGQSYENLLTTYILKPYGMKQTKIILSKKETSKMSTGYDMEGKETKYWYNKLAESAGGIHSTASDMLLFIKKQMSNVDSATNLSHQPTFGDKKEGVGLNWDIYTTKKGYLRLAHDGGTDGFTSVCMIYPEIKSGFVLITNNGDHNDEAFNNISLSVYFALIEKAK
jgi:CubicO group peptidase (beta-lactamase class C family)